MKFREVLRIVSAVLADRRVGSSVVVSIDAGRDDGPVTFHVGSLPDAPEVFAEITFTDVRDTGPPGTVNVRVIRAGIGAHSVARTQFVVGRGPVPVPSIANSIVSFVISVI